MSDLDASPSKDRIYDKSLVRNRQLHVALNVAWPLLRLPLLLVLLFIFRDQLASLIFKTVGLGRATLFIVYSFSTPVSRGLYFVASLVILLGCVVISRRLNLGTAYAVVSSVGVALFAVACALTSRSLIYAAPACMLLLINLAPVNLDTQAPSKSMRIAMMSGLGVLEAFFFWRYAGWLLRSVNRNASALKTMPRLVWALPGIVFASAASAALLNGGALVPIEQAIRMSSSVRIVASDGDFNWMQLDPSRKFLFVAGHGLNHLRRYDIMDWSSPPAESDVVTNYAQGFTYDPASGELYVHDVPNKMLLCIDDRSLKLRRTIDIKDLAPGDAWLAFDPRTDTISVSSEADEEIGVPFMLIDRSSGRILNTLDVEAGSLLLDPEKSVDYLNYFRRQKGVLIYDIRAREVTRKAEIGPNADRMAIWRPKNELLVTLPLESRIARLDAETLEPRGSFPTVFGVRTIAIDPLNNILFSGSLATGQLEIIELTTGKRLASYYLGPWLRTIELLPDRGLAYISSNGSIFELRYKKTGDEPSHS